jgi:5-oxoprolinase (ATP-hydrolysing)
LSTLDKSVNKEIDFSEEIIGTRALNDNLSDLKAQVAANNKGAKLLLELIEEYGLLHVHSYMDFIQLNAE